MLRDLGRDVPDLEKLYARKLWADFSYPTNIHLHYRIRFGIASVQTDTYTHAFQSCSNIKCKLLALCIPPTRTCVKMEPFVLLAFFPSFIVVFASNLAIFPLKRSVLGA